MGLDYTKLYLIEEFAEEYHLGRMGRRELLRRAVLIAGGVGAAAAVLRGLIGVQGASAAARKAHPSVAANVAPGEMRAARLDEPGAHTMPPVETTTAPVVREDDPAIVAAMVEFAGDAGPVFGYLARPSGVGTYPAIIAIHENRGMVEPIMDIARRFAKEGFVALAVDLISRAGGTASFGGDLMAIMAAHGQQTNETRLADMLAAVEYVKTLPYVNQQAGFGAIGYCFGGGMAYLLAANSAEIRAATPYYGSTDPAMLAQRTQAAILGFYGADDTRTTAQEPDVRAAMMAAGKVFDAVIYPNTGHAFFNNTNPMGGPFGYNPQSAADAWRRTLAWFMQYLG